MQVIYARCCGLDVHQETVVACVLTTQPSGPAAQEVRTVSTMTPALRQLSGWLREQQVEHVAMESTGVYWWPVFNVLEEEGHAVTLVNPRHMKAVPGRKTDVADSVWIADLLRHGLLRARCIPPEPIGILRALTRYRTTLTQERAAEVNRLQKTVERATIKLAAVASDVLGVSGQLMLHALISQEDPDPAVLAEMAKGRLRLHLGLRRQALEGRVKPHHRGVLARVLEHSTFLSASLAQLQEEIEPALLPCAEAVTLLDAIPGSGPPAAAVILAEIGEDMTVCASAKHLASWAGVCPGTHQSAGKRTGGTTTTGNKWLRGLLGDCAMAAINVKDSSFGVLYRRIVRRQGKLKALVAVMHRLLIGIYHVLRDKAPYRELGADYLGAQDTQRQARHHQHRLEQLGFPLTLTPKEEAA
jgi:transposase